MKKTSKTNKWIIRLGYFVTLITLISIFLLSQATQGSEKFEFFYETLLVSIFTGIILLFLIVFLLLWKIFRNYRHAVTGASLSLTILGRSLLLALLPLLFISFFAIKFLRYEFQSSFDKGISDALTNALVLSQKALNIRALQALQESQNVAETIAPYEYTVLQSNLEKIRRQVGANELTVFDEKGFIQAFSSADLSTIIPLVPEHSDFARVETEGGIFVIETDKEQFKIRVLTDINKLGAPNYYLQSVFFIPDTVSKLTDQVNRTVSERDRFNYLMPRVNNSFIFVLLLALLLACLSLILSSVSFANDMVQPIKDLIRGTKNVSQGDFSRQVLVKRQDDFGTLINSFNQMTNYLKTATEEAEINRQKVESERAYLAAVINHMTSAVITLDYKGRLLTFNEFAEKLLECSLIEAVYINKEKLPFALEPYKNFINQLKLGDENQQGSEIEIEIAQSEITKRFIARLTALPSTDDLHGGYVIIFDEFGQYLERQKQAAWEEVARRLAHEIKNPLTPILLATERLNYKLSGHLPEKEQQVLKRSIDVISKQVNSLKNMVNDFSDYAKPITVKKTTLSLNKLLKDVFDLYQGHFEGIHFDLNIQAEREQISGNANVLRQVFHNVIKNAIEACEKNSNGKIIITSFNQDDKIVVTIDDNGGGLPDETSNIFEPYITTKEKGTGLGLAIVKKIIDEHCGHIQLKNKANEQGDNQGVLVTLSFPLKK
ncbi:MAG: hypothetical protein CR975_01580 [Gammaproteobacteria bacterium]|nr:MAG: hypothetical protein CR975_01580 [Gammaproteobacteria bacterium]